MGCLERQRACARENEREHERELDCSYSPHVLHSTGSSQYLFLLTTRLTFDRQLAVFAHALRAEVALGAEAMRLLTVQVAATERI